MKTLSLVQIGEQLAKGYGVMINETVFAPILDDAETFLTISLEYSPEPIRFQESDQAEKIIVSEGHAFNLKDETGQFHSLQILTLQSL